jgi:hypothetical protein
MKNPHAVALGRLGGIKGGRARAEALTPVRRREIARVAGAARSEALSEVERKTLARRAAAARWEQRARIETAQEAPESVRRLLKSYDPAALRWSNPDHRYAIVRQILVSGDEDAMAWLRLVLRRAEVRALVRRYRGIACSEPERAKLRHALRLSRVDIPVRPHIGLRWRRAV